MEDNIERIKGELEEARHTFHQTVSEVNRKVEQKVETVTQFQPAHLVERHPFLSVCIAGALGFTWGNRSNGPVAVLVLGGLAAAVLSEAWHEARHGARTDELGNGATTASA
jgi:fatty acid desaturase